MSILYDQMSTAKQKSHYSNTKTTQPDPMPMGHRERTPDLEAILWGPHYLLNSNCFFKIEVAPISTDSGGTSPPLQVRPPNVATSVPYDHWSSRDPIILRVIM